MEEAPDWRSERIRSAIDGRNPTVLAELSAAYAVIGDVQFLPGYSLALTTTPGIDRLSDLPRRERLRYLADVDLLADAVETVCRRADPAYRRLDVEILGNTDALLHCHIWPRYEWEPPEIVGRPVWFHDPGRWRDPATALGPAHDELRTALTAEVVARRDSEEYASGAQVRDRTALPPDPRDPGGGDRLDPGAAGRTTPSTATAWVIETTPARSSPTASTWRSGERRGPASPAMIHPDVAGVLGRRAAPPTA